MLVGPRSVREGLGRVMKAPSGFQAPFPPPGAPSQGVFQGLFCVSAKLLSAGSRRTAQGMDTPLCAGLTVLSLSRLSLSRAPRKAPQPMPRPPPPPRPAQLLQVEAAHPVPALPQGHQIEQGASWVCLKRSVPWLGLARFSWMRAQQVLDPGIGSRFLAPPWVSAPGTPVSVLSL